MFAVVGIIAAFATVLFCVCGAVGVVLLMGTTWMQRRIQYYLRDRPETREE